MIVISSAECARRCGIRPNLLRHWFKQGVVPGILLGDGVQLMPAALAALSKRKW